MRCPACGNEIPPGDASCPHCGIARPPDAIAPAAPWATKLLAILAIAGVLVGIGYLTRYELKSRRFDTLHDSGIDSWAINLMLHSPAAEEALGEPIRRIGLPKGEARLPKEGGYAQAVLRVAGPKDTAILCIVGNRDEDGWDVEGAELILGGGRGTIDVTPPVSDEDVQLPSVGKVYLIPLGQSVVKLLAGLPAYYRAKLGIDVTVLPAVTPGSDVADSAKQEVIAEKLMEFMQRSYPQEAADPTTTLIGVTDQDMEDQRLGWDHTLNLRVDGRIGVISTLPLEPKGALELANPLVLPVRLRKIITKNIGLLDFPLTLSGDPTSVLAGNNGQPSDVDLMGENFRNAAGEWVPGWGDMDATVDITRRADGSLTWRLGAVKSPPIDTESELWQNDLSVGLFIEKQMDFYYDEPFPVRFARVYRPHDNWSRAFGIGTTDSFDPLLVGVFGSWCDVVLADGSRIHYSRDLLKPLSEVYDDGTGWIYPYGGTVLRYNGRIWTLKRTDGWTMVFPNGYWSHRPQQSAMIGLYDDHGHEFRLDRDGEGDLLHLVTPEGNRIDFRFDSDGRVIHATGNHGRTVDYAYDAKGRLVSVKDSTGRAERYVYDDRNQMTRIEDGSGHVLLTNDYDQAGWVVRQQLADGRTFRYRYQRDAQGNLRRVEFTDPQGYVIVYSFGRGGYWQTWPERVAEAKP
jgi:YD repeat-containing protein